MTDSAATEIKPMGADPPELETLELEWMELEEKRG